MKTRFVPSPTGKLHIGNLRTAYFKHKIFLEGNLQKHNYNIDLNKLNWLNQKWNNIS